MSGFPLQSLVVFVCLLMSFGEILSQQHAVKVVVEEGSDALLPCSISTNVIASIFDWRKDGQKEVFFYDSGIHSNNGRPGQDQQFKGRVSHFQDQLLKGNASIKIHDTKMADSGNYRCDFPRLQPRQTFNIELVVGASPEPCITTLDQTKDWSLLQCEVRGASPEPKVEWQDSSGNILPAEEPQVSERGGRYYVTLNITVTKTDRYRCEVTQEEINHQTQSETFVFVKEKLCEDRTSKDVTGWLVGIVIGAFIHAAVLSVLVATKCITVTCNQGPCRQRDDYEAEDYEAEDYEAASERQNNSPL